ncbi:branched-chain amino acid aminotransferase, partial [Helicobacter pylori]
GESGGELCCKPVSPQNSHRARL